MICCQGIAIRRFSIIDQAYFLLYPAFREMWFNRFPCGKYGNRLCKVQYEDWHYHPQNDDIIRVILDLNRQKVEYYLEKVSNGKLTYEKWSTVFLNDMLWTLSARLPDRVTERAWTPYVSMKEYYDNYSQVKCGFEIL